MPTMTRMHRHSSSSAVVEENRGRRRGPGAGDANKENFGVHFMSSPFGNASLIALQDLSNVHGKSPQRRSFSEGSGPRQATPQLAALRSCLPRGGVGVGGGGAALEDSQLSSSRMGDTTLDRMLDAIIESARKEVRYKPNLVATATTTAAPTTTVLPENAEWSETSVHEMEVRTPTHLKRQRVVRRKNPHKTTGPTTGGQRPTSTTTTAQQLEHIPSTKRCLSFSSSSNSSDLEVEEDDEENQQVAKRGSLATPPSHCTTTSSTSSGSSSSGATEFGEASPRGSIDLSISYDAKEQKLNVHVIRCRDLQRSHGGNGGSINAYVKVALSGTGSGYGSGSGSGSSGQRDQRTAVHRHSSRPYFDQRFSFPMCGGDFKDNDDFKEQSLQLAVWHRDRHLKRSEFLGCSTFPLSELLQPHAGTTAGSYKLQAQGCPPPSHRQSRENQHHNHQSHASVSASSTNPGENPEKAAAAGGGEREGEEQEKSTEMAAITATPQKAAATTGTGTGSVSVSGSTAAALTLNDEVISISIDGDPSQQAGQQPMRLSKKALHQRDADENLFLRFLELDPPADGNANSTTVGATGDKAANSSSNAKANESNANHLNGSASRRHSTMPNSAGGGGGGAGVGGGSGSGRQTGRTPFTMTKRLTRTEERGFGFSIVWTHPPRVEKVEAGLSADRCGILPGDYVIFVDMHNVVTMPEADVLNLIRSQGSALTLEIFRRSGAGATTISTATTATATAIAAAPPKKIYGLDAGIGIGIGVEEPLLPTSLSTTSTHAQPQGVVSSLQRSASSRVQTAISRPATACSGTTSSIEAAKRRLHLPQVTFSKESIVPITDNRRRFLLQLISREQNFTAALHFGVQRFVQPLVERKDLISPNDHRTLFQNIDELLRIAEDILEQLCSSEQQDQDQPQMNFASRVYLSKTTAICAAYKKYCNGIKRADCVLVNKSRQTGSEFIAFITEPAVPRKRPDLTMFIHRPLQHFREILKLMQLLAGNCHVDTEEHKNFSTVIAELQAAYREITVSSGLMEPLGEGRPLLTLQDLESRMVFTKCKPFTLAVQGRQWIFGGDLSRVEGRSVKPYWTLLFSDIIVFAKVSRDRVLFITEEPIPIANVVDSCFHMRKKTTEFRLTVDPNGRLAESPTGYCAPDLTRTPKRGARRKSLILRAPSLELKAVWQNLLQRQIFLVNAALGSTPLSSPLDSPDVLNTLVPLSDIGLTSASMGSMKLPSLDSIHLKQQQKQQVRLFRSKRLDSADSYENLQRLASAVRHHCAASGASTTASSATQTQSQTHPTLNTSSPARNGGGSVVNGATGELSCLRRFNTNSSCLSSSVSLVQTQAQTQTQTQTLTQVQTQTQIHTQSSNHSQTQTSTLSSCKCLTAIPEASSEPPLPSNPHPHPHPSQKLLEFSLSSVGRSFIDESAGVVERGSGGVGGVGQISLTTPETPTPNISPSSQPCNSDAFSNDFVPPNSSQAPNIPLAEFGGSWDLLELDLQLHEVNLDPCYDTDVEECIFLGDRGDREGGEGGGGDGGDDDSDDDSVVVDDPFGMLPTKPTPPDSLDL